MTRRFFSFQLLDNVPPPLQPKMKKLKWLDDVEMAPNEGGFNLFRWRFLFWALRRMEVKFDQLTLLFDLGAREKIRVGLLKIYVSWKLLLH
jgi:hypothetical protein